MVRFGKTGTDVTTAAVRLARAFTGRDRILICGGYHGWADWSVERNRGVPEDVRKWSTRVPYGSTLVPDSWRDCAAIIVEPERGPEYLQYLRELCDREGLVLIFDEVITGFRFDLGGAQKLFGVTPDLACFGKAMANGMPLSAVVGRRDIMRLMAPPDNIFFSGTFFGETLSLAASLATIRKMEREHVVEKLRFWGRELAHGAQTRINATGLQDFIKLTGNETLKRLSFHDADIAALFRREMAGSGTLIAASHNISFSHRGNEVARILRSYDHALHVVSNAILHGTVKDKLAGSGIAPAIR
jgi:glutamate-1-semialdehyde aminotransferase